ncbi:MAG: DUF1667 domain-containing protein [Lachnospiraceae bacterium]|nr:DUF1667 domain-containing protein [Lachnospiraceae bacterium]
MSTEVKLTCITCPVGCALTVRLDDAGETTVTGNKCPRGAVYGTKEVTNPTRVVTSTVRVAGGTDQVVSVKTATDIPKGKITDCMRALEQVEVQLPVHIGDIIVENIADTGVDIVATRSLR